MDASGGPYSSVLAWVYIVFVSIYCSERVKLPDESEEQEYSEAEKRGKQTESTRTVAGYRIPGLMPMVDINMPKVNRFGYKVDNEHLKRVAVQVSKVGINIDLDLSARLHDLMYNYKTDLPKVLKDG